MATKAVRPPHTKEVTAQPGAPRPPCPPAPRPPSTPAPRPPREIGAGVPAWLLRRVTSPLILWQRPRGRPRPPGTLVRWADNGRFHACHCSPVSAHGPRVEAPSVPAGVMAASSVHAHLSAG